MKLIAAIRTFLASIFIPGWGYWIVGKPRYGLVTVAALVTLALIVSWTRLILYPVGYYSLLFCVLLPLIGTAVHAASIEVRNKNTQRNWKHAFLFAVPCILVMFLLFSNRGVTLGYEIYRLPAQSMAPTLLEGDYIIVDTWRYRSADPANGDIVVFALPGSGVNYIKRIAGVPGDSVSLLSNRLSRNGRPVDEPYAMYDGPARPYHALPEQTVSAGHYILLGDNRNNSRDSRHFGAIPRENLVGGVSHVFFSSDNETGIRWHRIPTRFD